MNLNQQIKLTIGIPCIPERTIKYLEPLFKRLESQVGPEKDVEIISLLDNKMISIGKKRELLFSLARGKYTCIIDDDDDVVDDFISTLREKITPELDVDVINYQQEALIDGKTWIIKTDLGHNNKIPFNQLEVDSMGNPVPCHRPPWHWCCWKTDFVKQIKFEDINSCEDAVFVAEASDRAKNQLVIDKIMCKYLFNSTVSSAPMQSIPEDILNRVNNRNWII